MANYSTLKAAIQQVIKANGNNEITGDLLQQSLLAMINSLGAGYQFIGVATPSTDPGTPDPNVFYIASESGVYSNFGGLSVSDGELAILKYNGIWTKEVTGAATATQVTQLADKIIPLVPAKNLLNPITNVYGYYISTGDGTTTIANSSAYYSDFIPVDPGQNIVFSKGGVLTSVFVLWYGANKNYLGNDSGTHYYTAPANAKYVRIDRFNYTTGDLDQLEYGTTPSSYQQYKEVFPFDVLGIDSGTLLGNNVIVVDKTSKIAFHSISDAVAAAKNGMTILVMPGEYEESVIVGNKVLHIVGLDRQNTILYNITGDYDTPPLLQCAGSLRNMTIYAKRDNNHDYTNSDLNTYAVHIDWYGANQHYLIDNCHIKSDFSAAIGHGIRNGQHLEIRNCIIEATTSHGFYSHLGFSGSITLLNNLIRSLNSNVDDITLDTLTPAGQIVNLLAVGNASVRVNNFSTNYVLSEYSFGNLSNKLNH